MKEKRSLQGFIKEVNQVLVLLTLIMAATMLPTGILPEITGIGQMQVDAETIKILSEDFENGKHDGGFVMGSPTLSIVDEAHSGEKALKVSDRDQDWHSYCYNISVCAGKAVHFSAYVKLKEGDTRIFVRLKSKKDDALQLTKRSQKPSQRPMNM